MNLELVNIKMVLCFNNSKYSNIEYGNASKSRLVIPLYAGYAMAVNNNSNSNAVNYREIGLNNQSLHQENLD